MHNGVSIVLHLIWLERHKIMSIELSCGLKYTFGHSISSAYVNNNIDDFGTIQRKLTYSLRDRLFQIPLSHLMYQHPILCLLSPCMGNGTPTRLFCASLKIVGFDYMISNGFNFVLCITYFIYLFNS